MYLYINTTYFDKLKKKKEKYAIDMNRQFIKEEQKLSGNMEGNA